MDAQHGHAQHRITGHSHTLGQRKEAAARIAEATVAHQRIEDRPRCKAAHDVNSAVDAFGVGCALRVEFRQFGHDLVNELRQVNRG